MSEPKPGNAHQLNDGPVRVQFADFHGDFQAAVDALPACGGEIVMAPGDYVMSTPISFSSVDVKFKAEPGQ